MITGPAKTFCDCDSWEPSVICPAAAWKIIHTVICSFNVNWCAQTSTNLAAWQTSTSQIIINWWTPAQEAFKLYIYLIDILRYKLHRKMYCPVFPSMKENRTFPVMSWVPQSTSTGWQHLMDTHQAGNIHNIQLNKLAIRSWTWQIYISWNSLWSLNANDIFDCHRIPRKKMSVC